MKTIQKLFYSAWVIALFPLQGKGQTANAGILTVMPETSLTTAADFLNLKDASVFNDGSIYYQANFDNEGLYTFSSQKKSSYAVFQQSADKTANQQLSGSIPSSFYDVLFHSPVANSGFDLKNDMSINGKANFLNGIVNIDSLNGYMLFEAGAQAVNVSDKSFADGLVEKVGREAFVYPIGDKNIYRMAQISAPPNIKDAFTAKYYLDNSNKKHPHHSKTGVINLINDAEYWTVERANTQNNIMLTLSWNTKVTPAVLLTEDAKNLRILRWDTVQSLWVDEGGIVDVGAKTVTSPTVVEGYGIFTLGTVKPNLIFEGDVVIYNAVSPDGDGKNDYFIIDNIERFPKNTVQIFNRWGVKVYETNAYNSNGNVFKGISEGRVTLNKEEKLPTGTYFYIVQYEVVVGGTAETIKKAGYLHLENN